MNMLEDGFVSLILSKHRASMCYQILDCLDRRLMKLFHIWLHDMCCSIYVSYVDFDLVS